MKAVILADGLITRLSKETSTKPKPMVEIGGKPILWHNLKGEDMKVASLRQITLYEKDFLK